MAASAQVTAPATADEASALLAAASRDAAHVLVRGAGTKLGWGNQPRSVDLVCDTTRLDALVEHAAGDLVVTAQAGVRLAALQAVLAREGQMLALDPPEDDGTLGGTIAANASGPRRLRYGTARDLLIGVTVVLADGTVARSGGKVVKNVAGYDLGKLLCGSFGTLAVIVETTFRLHPLAASQATLAVDVPTPALADAAVQAVLHSQLVPTALDLDWPDAGRPGTLLVLLEGVQPGVEAQLETAAALLRAAGTPHTLAAGDADEAWARQRTRPWGSGDAGLKLRAPTAALCGLLVELHASAARHGLEARLSAHAGSGIAHAGLHGEDGPALIAAVREIRSAAEARDGSAILLEAPPGLRGAVEAFGSVGDAGPLMRRLKARFDPAGLLNPGRFAVGI